MGQLWSSEAESMELWRSDELMMPGRYSVCWCGQAPGRHEFVEEVMVLLISLRDTDQKTSPEMTHEVSVYYLDPREAVDYDTDLWSQKRLTPLYPGQFTAQFQAGSNAEAKACCRKLLVAAIGGDPRTDSVDGWRWFFPENYEPTHLGEWLSPKKGRRFASKGEGQESHWIDA